MKNNLRKTKGITPVGELVITKDNILKKQTIESFNVTKDNEINAPIKTVLGQIDLKPLDKVVEKDTRLRQHRR